MVETKKEIKPFLPALLEELNQISLADCPEPESEVEEGDKVIGEATDEMKRIFGLAQKYDQDMDQIMEKSKPEFEKLIKNSKKGGESVLELIKETRKKLHPLAHKREFLMKLFWASIAETYGLWGNSKGIRKGWKVVNEGEHDDEGMAGFGMAILHLG